MEGRLYSASGVTLPFNLDKATRGDVDMALSIGVGLPSGSYEVSSYGALGHWIPHRSTLSAQRSTLVQSPQMFDVNVQPESMGRANIRCSSYITRFKSNTIRTSAREQILVACCTFNECFHEGVA